ncbi:MAG: hypothetical protein WBD28_01235, partial [Candidatus Zixiibacteriota bacterium]
SAKLKEFASNIFVFTPASLRVAAAVASILLVFIVGKLYIDYRGTIPQRIEPVEKEMPKAEKRVTALEAPKTEEEKPIHVQKKGAPARGEKKKTEIEAPEIANEKLKMQKEKLTISEKAELKEIEADKGAELITKEPATRDIGKEAPVPEITEQEVLKPVEKVEAPKVAMRTIADVEEEKAKPKSKVLRMAVASEAMPKGATVEYWIPDSAKIPDVDYHQKGLSPDSLSTIIDFWEKFIKENPDDHFVEEAYLQIAAAYYHIFNKTKDEAIRVKGIKQIEEFLKISKEEETKEGLRQRLENLKSLKTKPLSKVHSEAGMYLGQTKLTTYRYQLLDGTEIPDVEYRQKVLSADSLRVIIDFWSKFIDENPEDAFVERAYLQIAASYYHIFNKTKDEAVRVEGIKQIEEFLKVSKREEIKEGLSQRLEKLKGLKEK